MRTMVCALRTIAIDCPVSEGLKLPCMHSEELNGLQMTSLLYSYTSFRLYIHPDTVARVTELSDILS